jgi:predicted amidophosphoribosyltransferase
VDLLRCPDCSASVRPGTQWCSLCFRDLRPAAHEPVTQTAAVAQAEQPNTVPAAVPVGGPALPSRAPDAPGTGLVSGSGAGWPCDQCETVVPLDLAACPDCGAPFLSRLHGDTGRHRSAGQPVHSDRLGSVSRPARLVGGIVIGMLLAMLLPVVLARFG